MNKYIKFVALVVILEILATILANIYLYKGKEKNNEKEYKVEIKRTLDDIKNGKDISSIDYKDYRYIKKISEFDPDKICHNEYQVEKINNKLYRFEYEKANNNDIYIRVNVILIGMIIFSIVIMILIAIRIVKPFDDIRNLPVSLAKGNLSIPIKESKNKYFGQFLWGMNMLREKLEKDKVNELALIKEKKTLILSISHDIKTPLSAIDLYLSAIKNDLYESEEKKNEALEGIKKNTAQIKKYVNNIVKASREDFLNINVKKGEFYLTEVIDDIKEYYSEKLSSIHTKFEIDSYDNCILKGDYERVIEVIQNIIENAIKYGDGKLIKISFDDEEDCKLVTVANSGLSLKKDEINNIFDSFYRGSNSKKVEGSGLGLYICKELLEKMDANIYASINKDDFEVTVVLRKS